MIPTIVQNQRATDLFQSKIQIGTLLAIALSAALCGCGTARVSSRHEIGIVPAAKPTIIYVADFDLDTANIKSGRGLLPPVPVPAAPFGELLPPLPGTRRDPHVLGTNLVSQMTSSLLKNLSKTGLSARRLAAGEAMPDSGWLVRGVFTEVNQGNQLHRSVIGFGLGKTDVQVLVDFQDLAQGQPKPFYELSTTADSGRAPGAGPTIILGPACVAARYVIASKDLDWNVKQTAARIAEEIVQRANQGAPRTAGTNPQSL